MLVFIRIQPATIIKGTQKVISFVRIGYWMTLFLGEFHSYASEFGGNGCAVSLMASFSFPNKIYRRHL